MRFPYFPYMGESTSVPGSWTANPTVVVVVVVVVVVFLHSIHWSQCEGERCTEQIARYQDTP